MGGPGAGVRRGGLRLRRWPLLRLGAEPAWHPPARVPVAGDGLGPRGPLGSAAHAHAHVRGVVDDVALHLGHIQAMLANGAEAYCRRLSGLRLLQCAQHSSGAEVFSAA